MQAALLSFRERWSHPPLDPRDVEERVALRYADREGPEVDRTFGPETRAARS